MYVSSAAWVVAVSSAANRVEFMSSLCLFRQGEHIANKKKIHHKVGSGKARQIMKKTIPKKEEFGFLREPIGTVIPNN